MTLIVVLLMVEVGARVYFAFRVGPSVLLYGTSYHRREIELAPQPSADSGTKPEAKSYKTAMSHEEWENGRTVVAHANALQGYSKYFPHEKRVDFDVDTNESFGVTINQRGFRGREISDRKDPGVIRVVTLGASSTFGYFSRDDDTYPAVLERLLNERSAGRPRFEVVNLGIPHLMSANILALFVMEGIPLDPDVVTFYEGNNDTKEDPEKRTLARAMIRKVGKRSIIVGLVDSLLDGRLATPYLPDEVQKRDAEISRSFISNVAAIHRECKDRGMLFIVANQQKNSQLIDRGALKGLTYAAEVELVRSRLLESKRMLRPPVALLTHAVLMKDLEAWAKANSVPFVDVIGRLDQDRDVLVSWVHLSPRGNRIVAEAFADEILKHDYASR